MKLNFLQDEFHNSNGSSGGQVAPHSHDYHAQWIGATPFTRSQVQCVCITCQYNSMAHQMARSFLEFKQPLQHCLVNTLPVASCSFKSELHVWLGSHHHPGPITIWCLNVSPSQPGLLIMLCLRASRYAAPLSEVSAAGLLKRLRHPALFGQRWRRILI